MIFKGFKFGMLLQFAIGPICLMVFNTSTTYGFWSGLTLVSAIAIIDSLYITFSGLGVAAFINKQKVKRVIRWLGCIVLVLFGINTIAGAFHISLSSNIRFIYKQNVFIQGLLLTASNPLTIIFWSGVFSAQVAENNYSSKQLALFGFGCVLSTLSFLTFVAACGSLLKGFLPLLLIQVLNVMVGIILICFGIRLLIKANI